MSQTFSTSTLSWEISNFIEETQRREIKLCEIPGCTFELRLSPPQPDKSLIITIVISKLSFAPNPIHIEINCNEENAAHSEYIKEVPFIVSFTVGIDFLKYENTEAKVVFYLTHYFQKMQPHYFGLSSNGSTCYMNSVLQFLFHLPKFRRFLFTLPLEQIKKPGLILCLQKLFYFMHKGKAAISTKDLTDFFGWGRIELRQQNDAEEFLGKLRNAIETSIIETNEKDLLKDLFMLESIIEYDGITSRTESEYVLTVPIDKGKTLEGALATDSKWTVENSSKYYTRTFSHLPPVMLICLSRSQLISIPFMFRYPERLDLSSLSKKDQPSKYTLYGVIMHRGKIQIGHYFTAMRTEDNDLWVSFDDAKVNYIAKSDVIPSRTSSLAPRTQSQTQMDSSAPPLPYLLIYFRDDQILDLMKGEKAYPQYLISNIPYENKNMSLTILNEESLKKDYESGLRTFSGKNGVIKVFNTRDKLKRLYDDLNCQCLWRIGPDMQLSDALLPNEYVASLHVPYVFVGPKKPSQNYIILFISVFNGKLNFISCVVVERNSKFENLKKLIPKDYHLDQSSCNIYIDNHTAMTPNMVNAFSLISQTSATDGDTIIFEVFPVCEIQRDQSDAVTPDFFLDNYAPSSVQLFFSLYYCSVNIHFFTFEDPTEDIYLKVPLNMTANDLYTFLSLACSQDYLQGMHTVLLYKCPYRGFPCERYLNASDKARCILVSNGQIPSAIFVSFIDKPDLRNSVIIRASYYDGVKRVWFQQIALDPDSKVEQILSYLQDAVDIEDVEFEYFKVISGWKKEKISENTKVANHMSVLLRRKVDFQTIECGRCIKSDGKECITPFGDPFTLPYQDDETFGEFSKKLKNSLDSPESEVIIADVDNLSVESYAEETLVKSVFDQVSKMCFIVLKEEDVVIKTTTIKQGANLSLGQCD